MMRILVCSALLLLLCPTAYAGDRTAQQIEVAEERFEKVVQRVAQKLEAALDEEIEKARNKGDLDMLVDLQEQERRFRERDILPIHPSVADHAKAYLRIIDREGDKLVDTYEKALKLYLQQDKVADAETMEAKLDHLRPLRLLEPHSVGDAFILVIDKAATWPEARDACFDLGGYLFVPSSDRENKLVHQLIGKDGKAWLGASDLQDEGNWVNVFGKPLRYTNWDQYQPDNSRGVQDCAYMKPNGRWDDGDPDFRAPSYVCVWNHNITRRAIVRGDATLAADTGADGSELRELKASTLKHNELVVAQRNRLQEAILTAEKEEAIVDAKAAYIRHVSSIKQTYIDELQGVLDDAIAGDRLEIAGKIKTQILRVRSQLEQLTREEAVPDVPTVDSGDENEPTREQPPSASDDNNPGDDESVDGGSEAGNNGTSFFGLPLE